MTSHQPILPLMEPPSTVYICGYPEKKLTRMLFPNAKLRVGKTSSKPPPSSLMIVTWPNPECNIFPGRKLALNGESNKQVSP